jgi:hypothetical protein
MRPGKGSVLLVSWPDISAALKIKPEFFLLQGADWIVCYPGFISQ